MMVRGRMVQVRVGKRRTIVIPKELAEELGIEEGTLLHLKLEGDSLVMRPHRSALDLAVSGKKYVEITLEELEAYSREEQTRFAQKNA